MESPCFTELPDDIHINILSFLTPSEISSVACTSRRFSALPRSPSLWIAMCDRRWGQLTTPASWGPNSSSRRLYNALDQWENLTGFWRRISHEHGPVGAFATCHPLLFFQWNSNCITGSQVSPCTERGSYNVVKSPFLWLGMSRDGEMVSYKQKEWFQPDAGPGSDPIPVSVSFVGPNLLAVRSGDDDTEVALGIESGSPPDRASLEGLRRQRRRTDREQRKSGLVTEHFVRIAHYFPTPSRPLQGLWKGICENRSLEFYLVAYDDIGGIKCRRVGGPGAQFSDCSPFFWTLNADFIEPPFSEEEVKIYTSRVHIADHSVSSESRLVSRMLCINSSYDLVLPDLADGGVGILADVYGRVWEYDDGTFGFGFLIDDRDDIDYIIDLKHIALDGQILDSVVKSKI